MIPFLDLKKITESFGGEIENAVARVAASGRYLLGPETEAFEREYADFTGTAFCVSCGNGLDALRLILRACIELGRIDRGDEVIVPANTYIATVLAITDCGLVPVLVDPAPLTCGITSDAIRRAIGPRTRAVMIVHLYGLCAYTDAIGDVCREHGLMLFEDNAQAHGCRFKGRRTGSLGLAAGHSFYPGKNLGALGDAGAVTTDDEDLARTVRMLGNYGSSRKYIFDYEGYNSRMDEIQAAVLRVKLPRLDADNRRRASIAAAYMDGIKDPRIAMLPRAEADSNVFHVFPVFTDDRDSLQRYLADRGVQTLIHYPVPPHKQKCYLRYASMSLPVTESIHRRELSLPMSPVLADSDVAEVIALMNSRP